MLVLPFRIDREKLPRQPGGCGIYNIDIFLNFVQLSPSIGSHDDQVNKEAGHGLGDADNTVGKENQSVVEMVAWSWPIFLVALKDIKVKVETKTAKSDLDSRLFIHLLHIDPGLHLLVRTVQ